MPGADDICIDPRLISQALRISRDPLVQELLSDSETTKKTMENGKLLNNIETVLSKDFIPSHDDILSTRKPTTGYNEFLIESDKIALTIVDVGGEKTERKKWLSCFESVNTVLFMASMAEYNLYMPEEPETNQLIDSLRLFESICNLKWFTHTALLLFLNKKDIFARKIKTVPLTVCFPDYDGPPRSYENASLYIWQQFEEKNHCGRTLYRHYTCAKDRANISRAFASVMDDIMRMTLKQMGMN